MRTDCSVPGFPVLHYLPEFVQTHVYRVGDAILSSHPLSSPSPPAPNPLSIRVFSNESTLRMRWPKYWSFSFSISPSNEHLGLISFRIDWFYLLAVQGTLKRLLQHYSSKALVFKYTLICLFCKYILICLFCQLPCADSQRHLTLDSLSVLMYHFI